MTPPQPPSYICSLLNALINPTYNFTLPSIFIASMHHPHPLHLINHLIPSLPKMATLPSYDHLIFTALAFFLYGLIFFLKHKSKSKSKKFNLPPGPPGWPIVGNLSFNVKFQSQHKATQQK